MNSNTFLIKNARIIDSRGTTKGDILISEGKIANVGKLEANNKAKISRLGLELVLLEV